MLHVIPNVIYYNYDIIIYVSWWFSIDRREADKQLMLQGNPRGTYLIRHAAGNYAYLCV